MFQNVILLLLITAMSFFAFSANATMFTKGETIFVAYPAANIKDDAFIIGQVKQVMDNGDYRISVMDYVEGHDYGVSCVPMVKHENNTTNEVWDMWTDTTKLETDKLDYVIKKTDALDLGYGKAHFIERNNLYIVFGRWKSDAPMLNIERLTEAQKHAKINGLASMNPAFELAKLHRASFYGDYGRPLMAFESIAFLVNALQSIEVVFAKDKQLEQAWSAKKRDWKSLAKNTKHYFLVEAIDKLVEDAANQLYEDGVEQAGAADLLLLKTLLKKYSRK